MTKPRKTSSSHASNTRSTTTKKQKLPIKGGRLFFHTSAKGQPLRIKNTVSWLSLDRTLSSRKNKYQRIITFRQNLKTTKLNSYTGIISQNITPKSTLKTITGKPNGRLTIIISYHKTIHRHLHGEQNSEDTCLIFPLSILTLMQVIMMKVTHRDLTPLLSHAPNFMIPAMVKTGKLAPFLTHL